MNELKKGLTPFGLTMIAVGACIGSGIFLTPSQIASHLNTPSQVLIVWGIGGIVALTGALTFAELGALFPGSGGVYVYLREAFGRRTAFLYGWVTLLVITSGAIAALCLAFAQYFNRIVPVGEAGIPLVGLAALIFITVVNIFGVKAGEFFSNVLTVLKLIGIIAVVFIGFYFGNQMTTGIEIIESTSSSSLVTSFGVALIGVLFSYGGWHHASYVSGEAINAQKTVPKAMMLGALIVAIAYLATNYAYLNTMSVAEMAASDAVAADAVGKVTTGYGIWIAILIAISTLGTAGIYTLSAPRIYYAMAKDRVFFSALAKVHPKYKTPIFAILLQSGWAIILLLFWQTFENLITYVIFTDWAFMTLAAFSVFIFRKRKVQIKSGTYRVFGFPVTPIIFIGISFWFIISTLIEKPTHAGVAFMVLCLGAIVYWFFQKENKKHDS